MSDLSAAFRELVVPDLRRACRLHALSVARERCDFTAAYCAVMAQSERRGSMHLPPRTFMELEQWVAATIAKTITDIDRNPEVARQIVDEALEGMWETTK